MGQFAEELIEFIGRTHPILVHLPIGMLVGAFLMALLSRKAKYKEVASAIPVMLLFGSIAAVLAALVGYLLSLRGGYEQEVLDFHQWLGIGVAVVFILVYLMYLKQKKNRFLVLISLIVLIGATGHFGGTLTHGKGYFTDALPEGLKNIIGLENEDVEIHKIENIQEAIVYNDVIAPILMQRCASCHGERKKEGDLALHNQDVLLKGGEGGKVLVAGDIEKSELYARLILPVGHEKRMPPKGRKPITNVQIKLIEWWIAEGASFSNKVAETNQSPEVKVLLAQLEKGANTENVSEYASLPAVNAGSEELIQLFQAKGVKVLPIASNSNYLTVNAINYADFSDKDLAELLKIKDNIVQLKLSNAAITDAGVVDINKMPNLKKLHVEYTKLSDNGIQTLADNKSLQYINLTGTSITDMGLSYLAKMKDLKQVFVYKTKVTAQGIEKINGEKSELILDTGGYHLPFLGSDTTKY